MNAKVLNVLIGADPELFCVSNGKVVPSIGLLPGTKEQPHRTEHGWVQPDNVLAEYNIPPAGSRDEFLRSIRNVERDLSAFVGTVVLSSYRFSDEELRAAGPGAFVFGCDPDYSAWMGGAPNPRPNPRRVGGLRTAGGHIHVGCDVAKERPLEVVRAMDVLLGLPSVLLDDDTDRRSVYGKAGAFRAKPYGVEYRTLSNFWLKTDESVLWAYDRTMQALAELEACSAFAEQFGEQIQAAINTSNADLAKELLHNYDLVWRQ